MKNVDLKDFVEQTLSDIIEGAGEAAKRADKHVGAVAPHYLAETNKPKKYNIDYDIQDVEFDIAVTATESTDGKTEIAVLNPDVQLNKESASVQKLKFSLTIGIKKGN